MTHPIVATARGWLGTRFHHQGRLKQTKNHQGGVDCLGLLVGVAAEQIADFGSTQSSVDVAIYQLSSVVGRGYPAYASI